VQFVDAANLVLGCLAASMSKLAWADAALSSASDEDEPIVPDEAAEVKDRPEGTKISKDSAKNAFLAAAVSNFEARREGVTVSYSLPSTKVEAIIEAAPTSGKRSASSDEVDESPPAKVAKVPLHVLLGTPLDQQEEGARRKKRESFAKTAAKRGVVRGTSSWRAEEARGYWKTDEEMQLRNHFD